VVHVLASVLIKVHRALRPSGGVLIIQPAPLASKVAVEVAGAVEFCQEFEGPNFRRYLTATGEAIRRVVDQGFFAIDTEGTTPEEGLYHRRSYDSVDAWIADHQSFCEDVEEVEAMSARIHDAVGPRTHRVLEYYREYRALLLKSRKEVLPLNSNHPGPGPPSRLKPVQDEMYTRRTT